MADNGFSQMLLAEIRRYHEQVERVREAIDAEVRRGLDDAPPAATKHRFRVIEGGRKEGPARVKRAANAGPQ